MSTAAQNIECFRSARKRITFTGTSLLTSDVVFQLLSAHGDATPLLELTEGGGVTISSDTAGYVDLTAAQTDRAPTGGSTRYRYTISDRTADDLMAHGEFKILPPRVADD